MIHNYEGFINEARSDNDVRLVIDFIKKLWNKCNSTRDSGRISKIFNFGEYGVIKVTGDVDSSKISYNIEVYWNKGGSEDPYISFNYHPKRWPAFRKITNYQSVLSRVDNVVMRENFAEMKNALKNYQQVDDGRTLVYTLEDGTKLWCSVPTGTKSWRNDAGEYSRVDGPAKVGLKEEEWYSNGVVHREGGPAIIEWHNLGKSGAFDTNGWGIDEYKRNGARRLEWRINGVPHNENGPVKIIFNNRGRVTAKIYMENGELHREGGPAVTDSEGKKYYRHGQLHRDDGPAVIDSDNNVEYWLNGMKVSLKDFQMTTKPGEYYGMRKRKKKENKDGKYPWGGYTWEGEEDI